VHPDVEALLALQVEDQAIRSLEDRVAAFEPRMRAMAQARSATEEAVANAQAAMATEERRQRDLQEQIARHKLLHERNLAQLDVVKRMRDATAAMAQVEAARRILAEEESDLQGVSRRLTELRGALEQQERVRRELEEQQQAEQQTIETSRAEIDAQLQTARSARATSATRVNRTLLSKYDRIRTARRDGAIFALRGPSCGHCDTSVPLQRRNMMAASGAIEVCETCGVLLYAGA
jgi:predicted  nucleic acid-binding Zn-ribbon protein